MAVSDNITGTNYENRQMRFHVKELYIDDVEFIPGNVPSINTEIIAGTGLTGGGNLSGDVNLALSTETLAALDRAGNAVADRTALKALDTSTITSAYLKEAGREGQFFWNPNDLSASDTINEWFSTAVDAGTDAISVASHPFKTGDPIYFFASNNGTQNGLIARKKYYVRYRDENSFQVAETWFLAHSGTIIDLNGDTQTMVMRRVADTNAKVTAAGATTNNIDVSTNAITCYGHQLKRGDAIYVPLGTADLPAMTKFFVRVTSSNQFFLHTSRAAAIAGTGTVDITDGTNFAWRRLVDPTEGIFVIPPERAIDGSQGAWVREIAGDILPEWFGVDTTGATDCCLDMQYCLEAASWLNIPVNLRAGKFYFGVSPSSNGYGLQLAYYNNLHIKGGGALFLKDEGSSIIRGFVLRNSDGVTTVEGTWWRATNGVVFDYWNVDNFTWRNNRMYGASETANVMGLIAAQDGVDTAHHGTCDNSIIENSHFELIPGAALELFPKAQSNLQIIRNCTFLRCAGASTGTSITAKVGQAYIISLVYNNTFVECGTPGATSSILAAGGQNTTIITGNRFFNCPGSNIEFQVSDSHQNEYMLSNNQYREISDNLFVRTNLYPQSPRMEAIFIGAVETERWEDHKASFRITGNRMIRYYNGIVISGPTTEPFGRVEMTDNDFIDIANYDFYNGTTTGAFLEDPVFSRNRIVKFGNEPGPAAVSCNFTGTIGGTYIGNEFIRTRYGAMQWNQHSTGTKRIIDNKFIDCNTSANTNIGAISLGAPTNPGVSHFIVDGNTVIGGDLAALIRSTSANPTVALGKNKAPTILSGTSPTFTSLFPDEVFETIATDAAATINPPPLGQRRRSVRHTGTLTADRAITLATAGALVGNEITVTRTGGGAFNLNVGTGPLKAMATTTWAKFVFDGSAWFLAESGSL